MRSSDRISENMTIFTKQPKRYTLDYAYYFLTFNTYKRKKLLHEKGIPEFLIKELQFYRKKWLKELIAYTIMPHHLHLSIEAKIVKELSAFLRDFKKYTSVEIKERLNLDTPYFWQRGTRDHYIRLTTETDFDNHLNYIFYNSWKHLRVLPKDFPYHNFLEWVDKGLFEINFCDFNENKIKYKE